VCYLPVVKAASAKLKNLLLALFLCLGMIGLSGAGVGPGCAAQAAKECGCCPMSPEETCCSAAEDSVPQEVPAVPTGRVQQQQVLQAILFSRPVWLMLPASAPIEFPHGTVCPTLSGVGVSVQALLCVRTV
jgi:hypothetical protein